MIYPHLSGIIAKVLNHTLPKMKLPRTEPLYTRGMCYQNQAKYDPIEYILSNNSQRSHSIEPCTDKNSQF